MNRRTGDPAPAVTRDPPPQPARNGAGGGRLLKRPTLGWQGAESRRRAFVAGLPALPSVAVSAGESTPELLVADVGAWERWLDRHHAESSGVRLVLAKRGATTPTRLTHAEALEVALMFGWIDGQLGKRDDATWTVRFTPRRPRGRWSKRNVAIAQRLISEGRMRPAGLAEVERARADGRWEAAYHGSASISVPEDLAQALAAVPAAAAAFDGLSAQNRYAILYRLTTAKRLETRTRRLEQFIDMLASGQTIYPQRSRS